MSAGDTLKNASFLCHLWVSVAVEGRLRYSGGMDDWKSRMEHEFRDGAQDLLTSLGGGLKKLLQRRELTDEELAVSYRQAFSKRIASERSGLAGHTSAFLGVNAVITGIWAITGAGFPWFLFPLFGWGIGYVSHRATVRVREAEYREVTAARKPTRQQLRIHRDLWKARRRWWGHVSSNGMIIALLVMTNVITGGIGSFPWSFIPSGFIAVGIFHHFGRYRSQERELTARLAESGFRLDGPVGWKRNGLEKGTSAADPVREARSLRTAILSDVKKYPEVASALGSDITSVLDQYITQVESLNTTYEEVGELLRSIPLEELRRDQLHLQRQIDSTTDVRLKEEYRRRLEQVDHQLKSHDELSSEQEILRLRVAGALQALNQLKIDVARTRSSQAAGNDEAVVELRHRSKEISRYLEDLRAAWDELS